MSTAIAPDPLSSAEAVIAAAAAATDASGIFPRQNIEALAGAGLLGLVSATAVGGQGKGLAEARQVVERVGRACSSTGMILCMHYSATAAIEALDGDAVIRRAIASGKHLSTLAFSEAGSRSHFWAPLSTAQAAGGGVRLDARKSWITAAGEADSYVWSSKPVAAAGASTLWLLDARSAGLQVEGTFDGLGLRGNASSAVSATGVMIPTQRRLGEDGQGFAAMMGAVLPWFTVLCSANTLGLMEAALAGAVGHITSTRHAHQGTSLADLPTIRAYLARARITADAARCLLDDTVAAVTTQRADAMLRVLEVKASSAEAALEVTDAAMRICGGAAFRKELGIERLFRDARAAHVMAPTSDVLYDFLGKAVAGLPLF